MAANRMAKRKVWCARRHACEVTQMQRFLGWWPRETVFPSRRQQMQQARRMHGASLSPRFCRHKQSGEFAGDGSKNEVTAGEEQRGCRLQQAQKLSVPFVNRKGSA
jgi:hypothetical protein